MLLLSFTGRLPQVVSLSLQVAQKYSEDAARQGGDLGWKRPNEVRGHRQAGMYVIISNTMVLAHLDGDALRLAHACILPQGACRMMHLLLSAGRVPHSGGTSQKQTAIRLCYLLCNELIRDSYGFEVTTAAAEMQSCCVFAVCSL